MQKSRSWPIQALLLSFALSISSVAACAQGASTVGRNLAELTGEADLIVQGHVISARVEPHPQFQNLMTVVVSVQVSDSLKGTAPKVLQFRQYIWDIRDRATKAGYAKGEELLLLLGPESRYGLRSPAGLEQGMFRITQDASGNVFAVNGRGNAALFAGIEQTASQQGTQFSARQSNVVRVPASGKLSLADLKDVIRTLAAPKGSPR